MKFTTLCKRFYRYLLQTKLLVMRQKWRFICMVTRSHTEYLSICDISEPDLKNFCGKGHAANAWKTKPTKNYAEVT